MDTSETYINMRRKAIGDLKMGIPIECPCNPVVNDIWVDSKGDWYYSTKNEVFQLERQDQLQEMVMGKVEHWTTAITGLHNLARFAETIEFDSMEQLWLAFVMRECYLKVWNGEDWN